MTGKTISHYKILEKLGEGGMGIVYKAEDTKLKRTIALKFLPINEITSEEDKARFLNEAQVTAALNHHSICTVFEISESDEKAFIAMEFIDGESLAEKIKKGPIELNETLGLAIQIVDGLVEAHQRGVIHRDIKPANLMLNAKGQAKIMDFGLAKLSASPSLTKSRTTVGTLAYMSPEQIQASSEVDHRTDIWSFGVVLYEMLTGSHPFPGDYEAATIYSIVNEEPLDLIKNLDIPEHLKNIVFKILEKKPEDRYQSALELLKDLEKLKGGTYDGLPADKSKKKPAHNLPVQLSSFIGRKQEISTIKKLLSNTRLLTLTGPGGTGKTRLCIEAASQMSEYFKDGIFFVPMASILEPELVPSTIAHTFGLFDIPGQSVLQQLKRHLKEKRLLLLIDNFEQIVEAAPIVHDLLINCQQIKVLVTSRIPLHISGEQELQVPPLKLPKLNSKSNGKKFIKEEAVTLFIQRAKAVKHDFVFDDENASEIGYICDQLDGLPLAIELAAARIKMFNPKAMLARLNKRLDLLKAGQLDFPERHKTLRESIAWSYDLLDENEQKVFRRLAVFVGGFNLEAVENLVNFENDINDDILNLITALVDKNLVRSDERSTESRFMLLETIREFGLECLENEDELGYARQAHAEYFHTLIVEAEPQLTGPDQGIWLDRLEEEHDNMRAVMSLAEEQGHADMGLKIASALWRFWIIRGYLTEGYQRFIRLLALPGVNDTATRAKALNAAGTIAHEIGEFAKSCSLLEQGLGLFRENEDKKGMATVLNNLGWVTHLLGDPPKAQSYSEEALILNQELGEKRGTALSINNLGWIAFHKGDFQTARQFYTESLNLRRDIGDERGTAFELTLLSFTELNMGNYNKASELAEEAFIILGILGDKQLLAYVFDAKAIIAYDNAEYDLAEQLFDQGIPLWRESGNQYGYATSLSDLAKVLVDKKEFKRAEILLLEAKTILDEIELRIGFSGTSGGFGNMAFAFGNMDNALNMYKKSLKEEMEYGNKFTTIQCLEAIARVKLTRDDFIKTAKLLGAAEAIRELIHSPVPPRSQEIHKEMRDTLKNELGAKKYSKILEEGKNLSIEEAVKYALST